MKYLIILAGIVLISGNILADDWDFRQVKWGMTTYDVKDREFILGQKWKFIKQDNSDYFINLVYDGELFNQYCMLIYQFKGSYGLFSASYSFIGLDVKNTLPDLVRIIKATLDKKYIETNLLNWKEPNWTSKDEVVPILVEIEVYSKVVDE